MCGAYKRSPTRHKETTQLAESEAWRRPFTGEDAQVASEQAEHAGRRRPSGKHLGAWLSCTASFQSEVLTAQRWPGRGAGGSHLAGAGCAKSGSGSGQGSRVS